MSLFKYTTPSNPGSLTESYLYRFFLIGFCTLQRHRRLLLNKGVSRLNWSQGVRSPLRSTWFSVYASSISFGFVISFEALQQSDITPILLTCNTRYRWLVKPYLTETFTLTETLSFTWRTDDSFDNLKFPVSNSEFPVNSWHFCSCSHYKARTCQRICPRSFGFLSLAGRPQESLINYSKVFLIRSSVCI